MHRSKNNRFMYQFRVGETKVELKRNNKLVELASIDVNSKDDLKIIVAFDGNKGNVGCKVKAMTWSDVKK